jgi:hypothetical protein
VRICGQIICGVSETRSPEANARNERQEILLPTESFPIKRIISGALNEKGGVKNLS